MQFKPCSLFLHKINLHSDSRSLCSSKQNNEALPVLILLRRVFGFRSRLFCSPSESPKLYFQSILAKFFLCPTLALWQVKYIFYDLVIFCLVSMGWSQACLFLQRNWKLSDLDPHQYAEGQEKLGLGPQQFVPGCFP